MFDIKELGFIKGVLKGLESQGEMTLSIIEKIDRVIKEINECKQCLWRFHWDCGRQGEVEGLFKATKEEVVAAIGKDVYFGEILGKHSEVYGVIEDGDITLESDDPLVVLGAKESGYNPLDYAEYECSVCGDKYRAEDYDFEAGICNYCKSERDEEEK